ncbi:restriction endonuclease subunit S [Streptomyces goshikiensis]|uniref:restriction endonuclease subunit S n=1 Tax=Streptomyces TaxID=1883 RepID=UPI00131CD92D|nr:restriction endonuclease subunit S [Streptomyces sp. CB02120-2]
MHDLIEFSKLVEINPQTVVTGRIAPFVGMEDVSEDGRLLNIRRRSVGDLSGGLSVFRDDDVLFAKITPCMENGKGAHVAGLESNAGLGSTEFHVLRARRNVVPRYIYHWTQSKRFRRAAEAMMAGSAGHRRVPVEFFHRYLIPRFTFAEQQQIVEILDAVDVRLAATAAALTKQQALANGVISHLLSPPDGKATEGWEVRPVNRVGEVQIGRQLSPSQLNGRHMRPYLRVANVHDGYVDYSDVLEMNFTPAEFATFSIERGDVLLNEGQSLELVGRSALYDGPPGMCFQNTLIRFRPRHVLPTVARAIFKRWLDTGEFMKIALQTTSIAHLGSERFAAMPFVLPPMAEQQRIAETVDALEGEERAMRNEQHRLVLLRQGLMEDLLGGRVRV